MIVYSFLIIGLEMLGGVEPIDMFVTFSSSTGALLGLLQVFTTSNWNCTRALTTATAARG